MQERVLVFQGWSGVVHLRVPEDGERGSFVDSGHVHGRGLSDL